MPRRSLWGVACDRVDFSLYKTAQYSTVGMVPARTRGSLYLLAFVNDAAVSISLQIAVRVSAFLLLGERRKCDCRVIRQNSVVHPLRNYYTAFHSNGTILLKKIKLKIPCQIYFSGHFRQLPKLEAHGPPRPASSTRCWPVCFTERTSGPGWGAPVLLASF